MEDDKSEVGGGSRGDGRLPGFDIRGEGLQITQGSAKRHDFFEASFPWEKYSGCSLKQKNKILGVSTLGRDEG